MFSKWKAGSTAIAFMLAGSASAIADVSIGILTPSSGKGAAYGQQQLNAINMFMERYADIGGKAGKLKLVIYDTRGENTEAINLSSKLMDTDPGRSDHRPAV